MITVLFEVTLKEGMKEACLSMKSKLGEELTKQEGTKCNRKIITRIFL
jgi:hypothetical protein